ncbi:MAG: hypothetical protein AAGE52_40395, partial [Myxococcota bacterium]
ITRGGASIAQFVDVLDQVLSGLSHAHERGILHRQVSPSTIRLVPDRGGRETVRLSGVGTSTALPSNAFFVSGDVTMAPEQVLGKAVDERTDLFAAAATAYAMLVGEGPFAREATFQETLRAIVYDKPLDVRMRRPRISRALAEWIERGMHKDPRERFSSASEMQDALLRALVRTIEGPTRETVRARDSSP